MNRETLVGRDLGWKPYAAAIFSGVVLLLMVACAAPDGESRRWLGMHRDTVLFSALMALLAIRRRALASALAAPFLVQSWRMIWGASRLGYIDTSSVETWLAAALFTSLAWLALRRREGLADANDRNLMAISTWVSAVGLVTLWQALANSRWYTLKNLYDSGTYVSSTAWPDTKVITLVLALSTLVNAAAMVLRARARRVARRKFLPQIVSDQRWSIREGDEQLPSLLDPPGDLRGVLYENLTEGDGPYREGRTQRAVARVPLPS